MQISAARILLDNNNNGITLAIQTLSRIKTFSSVADTSWDKNSRFVKQDICNVVEL